MRNRSTDARRAEVLPRRGARGAFLLEALIALLIFSFGALAIAGLYGRVTRHGNDAHHRAEAALLAHATLAAMRAAYPGPVFASFDSRVGGVGYRELRERASRLPGAADDDCAPVVRITDGPTAQSRRIDVALFWRNPGEQAVHRYDAATTVARN